MTSLDFCKGIKVRLFGPVPRRERGRHPSCSFLQLAGQLSDDENAVILPVTCLFFQVIADFLLALIVEISDLCPLIHTWNLASASLVVRIHCLPILTNWLNCSHPCVFPLLFHLLSFT